MSRFVSEPALPHMSGSSYDILFQPVQIGPVTAPNRFYAVPHATGHGWSQPLGSAALRAMKAEGGWGVVAAQITEIGPESDMANHQMDRIWDDGDLPVHTHLVEKIHEYGALAAIELAHGGMRARNFTTGLSPVGPSAGRILRPEVPLQSRAMDMADIRAFREAHKAAARRAAHAGYDILYVYAAHDLSLLSHFLSRRTNQRSDTYGGSFENRLRLLREVLEDTLEVAAGSKAVALRFSVAEPDKADGLKCDAEGRDVVEALAELPDLWDVNLSGWPADSQSSRFSPEGFQLPFTDFVKSVTSKPVVGVGRFTSPDTMAAVIRKGQLDLIGAARPSIADPFLPQKIRDGRIDEIRECIGCNVCVSMDAYGVPIRCTQNPTIGEEWRRGWHPERSDRAEGTREVLIVGSGPAGLECAVAVLKSGHRVTIAEARNEAGGRVTCESRLPGLSAWARVRDDRLHLIQSDPNATLYLSSHLSAEDVLEFGADEIVFATGSHWRGDGAGATQMKQRDFGAVPIYTPDDVMGGNLDEIKGHVVVFDDDHNYMASLMVEFLSAKGLQITYVTPLPSVATWTDMTLEQAKIIARMNTLGVAVHVNTAHVNELEFEDLISGRMVAIQADALMMVGARLSNDKLYHDVAERAPGGRYHRIGDCYVPGLIQSAVFSGHTLARELVSGVRPPLREYPVVGGVVS